MQTIVIIYIFSLFLLIGLTFGYFLGEVKKLTKKITELEKRIPPTEEYNKSKEDIKTLYQNQQLLLSLVNAVRVRINNFYAKKLQKARLKSAGFEATKEFGETEDSI